MQKDYSQWNLNQWLTALDHRHTQEIQLGLDRILSVAQKINIHRFKAKVISVAGTNGKGSTASALEIIYHTAGYKVGTFTSPHLIHFNERIRVNLTSISDDALCHAFTVIEDLRKDTPLTYFEMSTVAALWYFQQLDLDLIILEVGLGGRLDATNIVDADLAIITTIDYDHQQFLGDTLESIAHEKAGVLRAGKPFIYADNAIPKAIQTKAELLNAPLYLWDKDYFVQEQECSWEFSFAATVFKKLPKPAIQLQSAAAALMASILLQSTFPVNKEALHQAFKRVHVQGRLQYQPGSISVLYDVSHNAQSVRLLADTLKKIEKKRVHAVFSALQDKDIQALLIPLKGHVDFWYPSILENKRACSADFLLNEFEKAELLQSICYNSPFIAFQAALEQARVGDLILVYGSFFTVAQVMTAQPA